MANFTLRTTENFAYLHGVTFFKLGPNCVTSQILKDLPHFLPLFI